MSCASVLFTLCTYTPHIAPQCSAPALHQTVPQCPHEIPKTRTKASGVLGNNTIVVNIGISILSPKESSSTGLQRCRTASSPRPWFTHAPTSNRKWLPGKKLQSSGNLWGGNLRTHCATRPWTSMQSGNVMPPRIAWKHCLSGVAPAS